jgi:acetyl-CoA carboxylase/biotin carboxylase 1
MHNTRTRSLLLLSRAAISYREMSDGGDCIYRSVEGFPSGPLDGRPLLAPYENKDRIQGKRYQAQETGTTYVYDYIELIQEALARRWRHAKNFTGMEPPAVLVRGVFK